MTLRRWLVTTSCLCLLALGASAGPEEPEPSPSPTATKSPDFHIIPDKLTAEDPEPLDPGQVELEFYFFHSKSSDTVDKHDKATELITSSFSYGIVKDLDFSIISGASSIFDVFHQRSGDLSLGLAQGPARGGGLTNLEIEFRYKFLAGKDDDWALAALLGTSSRNDFKRVGSNFQAIGNFQSIDASLVGRKDFGRFTTDAEFFVSLPLPTHNQSRFTQTGINLAAGYQLNDWLQPSVELNYLHISPLSDDFDSLSATAGLILKPADWLTLYLGYQRTLAARNTDVFNTYLVGTKFTF